MEHNIDRLHYKHSKSQLTLFKGHVLSQEDITILKPTNIVKKSLQEHREKCSNWANQKWKFQKSGWFCDHATFMMMREHYKAQFSGCITKNVVNCRNNWKLKMAGKHTHTHTRLMTLCPGLPVWAGTRKVKPIWILLKQETVSGSGISWTICKSAPRSRQITMPAPHHSVFYRPDALPAAQPTASKHWRHGKKT